MFPVNPDDIIAHRGHESRNGYRAEAGIVTNERRDLFLVCIPDGLASAVRLEKRRTDVCLHPLGGAEVNSRERGTHGVQLVEIN